jgi:uncharacterized protein (UPF0548 family)
MFLIRRPSAAAIARFLDRSRDLPLSYSPVGIAAHGARAGRLDEQVVAIGNGAAAFEHARAALEQWQQFDLGWVELFPRTRSIEVGTVVAVLIRHVGMWSLNGARVVYHAETTPGRDTFGYAYGTLTNHAESGEELFEVFIDRASGDVMYRIRAISWPQSALARIGAPIVRHLQARFRRDSAAAVGRALRSLTETTVNASRTSAPSVSSSTPDSSTPTHPEGPTSGGRK